MSKGGMTNYNVWHHKEPRKIFFTHRRVYERFFKDKTAYCNVYDATNNKLLRTEHFNKSRSQMQFIKMNAVILKIKNDNNISLKDARDRYNINKAVIMEGRISNIMIMENMSKQQAVNYYNELAVKGDWLKIKSYSSFAN